MNSSDPTSRTAPVLPPASSRFATVARWVAGAIAVALVATVCVGLGRWQFSKHHERSREAALIDANYRQPPSGFDQLVARASPLPHDLRWRPVRVEGTYDSAHQLLWRNRVVDSVNGYDVIVPLRISPGPGTWPDRTVLVNRGWVAVSPDADPPPIPAAPSGRVTVVGHLRNPQPPSTTPAPDGQVNSLDTQHISQLVGYELDQAWVSLVSETPQTSDMPLLARMPDRELGPHLGYALQWWLFAAMILVGYVVAGVKAAAKTARTPPVRTRIRDRLGNRKPARDQRSDEEWEDSLTGD